MEKTIQKTILFMEKCVSELVTANQSKVLTHSKQVEGEDEVKWLVEQHTYYAENLNDTLENIKRELYELQEK